VVIGEGVRIVLQKTGTFNGLIQKYLSEEQSLLEYDVTPKVRQRTFGVHVINPARICCFYG